MKSKALRLFYGKMFENLLFNFYKPMNDKEYFADKTAVSNSMLHDYVTYDKYNNRLVTIDYYIAKHIDNINLD